MHGYDCKSNRLLTGEKISGRVRYEGKICHSMFWEKQARQQFSAVQMNCAARGLRCSISLWGLPPPFAKCVGNFCFLHYCVVQTG